MVRFSRVDRAFARFCRTGDPSALGRVFDATASDLLKVASYVLGDRERARDVVQSAFLHAIEKRGEFDRERRVMPWLCGVVANLARSEKRRLYRVSPVSAAGGVVDPARVAEEQEFREVLARTRASLPDPYRAVLDLHLEHGLDANEIARVLDRPAGTVRTQIVRGLDLLRRRIPRGFVMGVGLMALSPGSLVAMRSAVLDAATRVGAAPVAASAASMAILIGGTTVQKKLWVMVSAGVVLLGLGIWLSGARGANSGVVVPATETPDELRGVAVAHETGEPGSRTELVDSMGETSIEVAPTGSVEVFVRWSDTGAPAPRQDVQVVCWGEPHARLRPRRALTDTAGRVQLDGVPTGTVAVQIATGSATEVEVIAGEVASAALEAEVQATIDGVVVDAQGRRVADAEIWVASEFSYRKQRRGLGPGHGQYGAIVGHSDAAGRFVLRVGLMQCIAAFKNGYGPSESVYPESSGTDRKGQRLALTLKLGAVGGAIEVVVRDPRGRPVQGAHVLAGIESPHMTGTSAGAATTPARRANTHSEGMCTIDGLGVGPLRLQVRAPGFAPFRGKPTLVAGNTTRVAVELVPGATVTGRVRDQVGEPVAGALVYSGDVNRLAGTAVTSDVDGRFVLAELPSGDVVVVAWKKNVGEHEETLPLVARRTEWNPVLSRRPAITGVVLGSGGQPVAKAWLAAYEPGGSLAVARATSDSQGEFALGPLKRGVEYHVNASLPFSKRGRIRFGRFRVFPETKIVLQATKAMEPTASIRGRLVRADGSSFTGASLLLRPVHGSTSAWVRVGDDGSFASEPQPPGRILLTVNRGMRTVADLGEHDLVPNGVLDLGNVEVPAPGAVKFEFLDGVDMTKGAASLYRNGRFHNSLRVAGDNLHFDALPVGDYVLCVRRGGTTPRVATASFRVESGATTRVSLTAIAAHRTKIRFKVVGDSPGWLQLNVRDARGILALRELIGRVDDGTVETVLLPKGRWKVEAVANDGRVASRVVTVPVSGEFDLSIAEK